MFTSSEKKRLITLFDYGFLKNRNISFAQSIILLPLPSTLLSTLTSSVSVWLILVKYLSAILYESTFETIRTATIIHENHFLCDKSEKRISDTKVIIF